MKQHITKKNWIQKVLYITTQETKRRQIIEKISKVTNNRSDVPTKDPKPNWIKANQKQLIQRDQNLNRLKHTRDSTSHL